MKRNIVVALILLAGIAPLLNCCIIEHELSVLTLDTEKIDVAFDGGEASVGYTLDYPLLHVFPRCVSSSPWVSDFDFAQNGFIRFKIEENTTDKLRSAVVTVSYPNTGSPSKFTINQEAAPVLILDDTETDVPYSGGNFSLTYRIENPKEGVTLDAESGSEWIAITETTDKLVKFRVSENNDGAPRSGTIILKYGSAVLDFTVNQTAKPSIVLDDTETDVPYSGGNFSLKYRIENPKEGATLSAESGSEWIAITETTDKLVKFRVSENNDGAPRSGTIILKYGSAVLDFTVNQTAKPSIVLDDTETDVPYSGGNFSLKYRIENPKEGATLSAESGSEWIAITETTDKLVKFHVSENSEEKPRSGIITLKYDVAVRDFTVNQKAPVAVTGVSLDKTSLTLTEGESYTLTATVTPSDATNKNVNWSSDNTSVATVDDAGKVTAVSAGSATITVKTENGGKTATCSVTVNEDSSGEKISFTANGVSFEMVYVKGGTFRMGAQKDDPSGRNYDSEAKSDESPVHQVTLSDYYVGQTEVTQGLWKAVMGTDIRHQRDLANPDWSLHGEGDSYPMYYVSWNDVQTFLSKLNSITGKNFVLPTEAQWEFAARGGTKSNGYKYSGGNDIDAVAWYSSNSSSSTHSAGTKQPNELGIYDMSGNVYEWCSDWYGNYDGSSQTNPQGPSSGSYRVLRGGSWSCYAVYCRVAFRNYNGPACRDYDYGFRLALLP